MSTDFPDQHGAPGVQGEASAAGGPATPGGVPPFRPADGEPAPAYSQPIFAVPPARSRRRMTLTSILLAAAAVVAVAGVAFAVGRVTAPASTTPAGFGRALQNGGTGANGNRFPGAGQGGGLFGAAAGGLELRGTVTAVNGDTITVQLENGRTIEVQTSSSTTYHTQVSGSASDVGSGKSVIVQVQGGAGLRGAFGQGGTTNGTVTLPATDVTVTGQ